MLILWIEFGSTRSFLVFLIPFLDILSKPRSQRRDPVPNLSNFKQKRFQKGGWFFWFCLEYPLKEELVRGRVGKGKQGEKREDT